MGRADFAHRLKQCVDIGDVALNEGDGGLLLAVQDLVESMRVFLQVEDPDFFTGLAELLGDPRSDAPKTAGQEHAHLEISFYHPDAKPQTPGVKSSTELPPGSRKYKDRPPAADNIRNNCRHNILTTTGRHRT